MPNSAHPIEWFLGRDGKQHGPISDMEMRKLAELGHLRPTDLVWRQGMPNWVPAPVITAELAPRPAPPEPVQNQPPQQQPQAAPVQVRAPESEARPTAPTAEPRGPRDGGAVATNMQRPAAPAGSLETSGSAPVQRAPQPGAPSTGYPTGPGAPPPSAGPRPGMVPAGAPHGAPGPQGAGDMAPRRAPPPPVVNRNAQPGAGAYGAAGPNVSGSSDGTRPPPPRPSAPPPPTPRRQPMSEVPGELGHGAGFDDAEKPRSRFPVKLAIALVLLSALGGSGVALYRSGYFANLPFVSSKESGVPVVRAPKSAMKESPLKGFADTPQEVDAGFQKAPLWQLIKREFPDWYNERIAETVKLREEKKDDKAIAAHLTGTLVDLRRKNAAAALAASPERLKFVAAAFVENLVALQKQSVDACYGFISQGESSPAVVELLRSAEHSGPLQAQFTAIFEAVIDGRRAPRVNQQPRREDYDVLAQQLAQKGWSPTDLQVFSDASALARAQPAKVCQMVQDWFSAQLSVKDEATQLRLLVEALKPVVAG